MSASDTGQTNNLKTTKFEQLGTPASTGECNTHLIFGCGYLGKRIANCWQHSGNRVVTVSRSPEAQASSDPNRLSYDQLENTNTFESPISTVVYSAGMDKSQSTESQWFDCLKTAVQFALMKKCRFIFTSSTGVYAQSDGRWVDETMPAEPVRERARPCREAEGLIQNELNDFFICRLAGIYGPGRLPRLEPLKNGKLIPGNPDAWLNLVHVEDAARIIVRLGQLERTGQTVNIADGVPLRRSDYFKTICTHFGFPDPVFESESNGSSIGKRVDIGKLKELLGSNLNISNFDDQLKACIDNSA